jgi:hypothetical protein
MLFVAERDKFHITQVTLVHSIAYFLDAKKALDAVEHCSFFRGLINRDTLPLIIRVLSNIYTGQQICTLWNGAYSKSLLSVSSCEK